MYTEGVRGACYTALQENPQKSKSKKVWNLKIFGENLEIPPPPSPLISNSYQLPSKVSLFLTRSKSSGAAVVVGLGVVVGLVGRILGRWKLSTTFLQKFLVPKRETKGILGVHEGVNFDLGVCEEASCWFGGAQGTKGWKPLVYCILTHRCWFVESVVGIDSCLVIVVTILYHFKLHWVPQMLSFA
jgi:hypothetical protein